MAFRTVLKNALLAAVLAWLGVSAACAGVVGHIFNPVTLLAFPATPVGSPSAPLSVTIGSANNNQLTAIQIAGPNAADFALTNGGTCAVGTQLSTVTTCTQNILFTPTAPGNRTGTLLVGCTPVGMIGGFNVNCDGIPALLQNLQGLGAAIVGAQAIPALDEKGLTVLALLLMALASYFGFRSKKN